VLVLIRPARPTATLELLVADGVLSSAMAEFLRGCVRLRKSIVVSAGHGAGGIELLRAIGCEIGPRERIVTVEQCARLDLPQPNVVSLETAFAAGARDADLRELVRWALRLEPDRLVAGDCRGGEALEILQAMAGPLGGSLLLVHGHSARECTGRIEAMMLLGAGDASARAVREVLARAIDVVVQVSRFADGAPRVTEIAVVNGMEVDLITVQPIFTFCTDGPNQNGQIRGRFLATGAVPHFYSELQRRGEQVDLGLFREDT
ncbi:MAG: CpaF family protein, partial [Deltaproteobacteria bacterium]|nr:CpaF family protein [Deltaproteobacteria bacterium]